MSKVFFPKKSIIIDASCPPHPQNTQYKISVGEEDWSGSLVTVYKVQMMYDGVVSGRRSPSFPVGTDDLERVNEELEKLKAEFEKS